MEGGRTAAGAFPGAQDSFALHLIPRGPQSLPWPPGTAGDHQPQPRGAPLTAAACQWNPCCLPWGHPAPACSLAPSLQAPLVLHGPHHTHLHAGLGFPSPLCRPLLSPLVPFLSLSFASSSLSFPPSCHLCPLYLGAAQNGSALLHPSSQGCIPGASPKQTPEGG